jgi:DNA-binding transcriptional LysR family regulator
VEAVSRHRHFTRAAEELNLAQSVLSQRIRQLETELGTRLFDRTSRRVAPTEAGLAVAASARRVLAELDRVRRELDQLGGVLRGRVRVGALAAAGDIDVAGLLTRFGRTHTGVELGLHEGVAADMLARLGTGELDVAFFLLADPAPNGVVVEQLGWEEVVAAFAPDRAPAGGRIGVADLTHDALVGPRRGSAITAQVERRFAEACLPLHLTLGSSDSFLLGSLAARGFATAILPRSLAGQHGSSIEVRRLDPLVRLPVVLAHRGERTNSPAAQALVEFILGEVRPGAP